MWSIYAVIIANQHLCIPSHYQKCETMTAIVMAPKCLSANSYVIVFLLLSCAAVGCIELQLTHWWYDAGGFSCPYAAQSVI